MAAVPTPPAFTVLDGMIKCRIQNDDNFGGQTFAESVTIELFDDDFQSCLDEK